MSAKTVAAVRAREAAKRAPVTRPAPKKKAPKTVPEVSTEIVDAIRDLPVEAPEA